MSSQIQHSSNDLFTEDFAQLFEESIKQECKEGTVARGTIVNIENDVLVIDVGLKSEGRVPLKEFISLDGVTPDLQIGDQVDVYVEKVDGKGRTIISREKAIREESWTKFEDLYERQVNVQGIIIGRVKGGFAVELGGIIAFLPGSQVDIRPIKDIATLMNVAQPFKILKMDRDQGNIVVSRRAILEESRQEARSELLSNISEGSILDGVVKNITDYGAFIDLGSIDGLLHITDVSWNKISHPSEMLTLGQQLKVIVIKYNQETQRVSLGLKQLEKNPWDQLAAQYQPGLKFKGTITTVTDYGAFVELEPNVEGLVYHTEISWNSKNIHPRKLVKTGDEVDVVVLEIDIAKHRISLSMKQSKANPWVAFAQENPVGTIVEGMVSNIADFGIFLTLNYTTPDSAIDALIPASELSWDETPEKELKKYKREDIIKGTVLSVDSERERITIGVKQLTQNTNATNSDSNAAYAKDSIVTCTVTSITKDAISVEVEEGLTAVIKKSDLSKHRAEQRPERFAVGERVDAKVVSYDSAHRKIALSIKALEVEQEQKAIEEYGSANSGASLGDILGAALNKSNSEK